MITKFSITGLDKLNDELQPAKVRKLVETGIGQALSTLHSELRYAVQRVYKAPKDLDSVLSVKSKSTRAKGQALLSGELGYEVKPIQLAQYMQDKPLLGNIPPLPKKREGWVHTVEVIRRRKRVVMGRKGFGGFTPRTSTGSLVRINGKAVMMERDTKSKYPVHNLYGPSLASLAIHLYDTDPKVQRVKEQIPFIILEKIEL